MGPRLATALAAALGVVLATAGGLALLSAGGLWLDARAGRDDEGWGGFIAMLLAPAGLLLLALGSAAIWTARRLRTGHPAARRDATVLFGLICVPVALFLLAGQAPTSAACVAAGMGVTGLAALRRTS